RHLRILLVTLRNMSLHNVGLQAAAFTFFTMVAIVPFIAVAYAITKGFGFSVELESLIYANFSEQEEIVQWVLTFANNLLNTSKSGLFGIIGFITFFWSVVWAMISVEQAFNQIWQVKSNRSILYTVSVYIGLIILSPVVIGGFFVIPLGYNYLIQTTGLQFAILSPFKPVVVWLLHFVFLATFIFMAYKLIPSTKVRSKPALHATVLTTLAFMAIQMLYVETQLFVSKLNAVYGAFAAIPFFMVWMNMNWFLILLGAEFSYTFQNDDIKTTI
ncbi:MAG: YihY/virulence factor BrkB family protein, partial [Bacteroidales bacterium]|nr:YihY/virulence factor BrkB family protein [Bacteroidales bacterium]